MHRVLLMTEHMLPESHPAFVRFVPRNFCNKIIPRSITRYNPNFSVTIRADQDHTLYRGISRISTSEKMCMRIYFYIYLFLHARRILDFLNRSQQYPSVWVVWTVMAHGALSVVAAHQQFGCCVLCVSLLVVAVIVLLLQIPVLTRIQVN